MLYNKKIVFFQKEFVFFSVFFALLLQNTLMARWYWTVEALFQYVSLALLYSLLLSLFIFVLRSRFLKIICYGFILLACSLNVFLYMAFKTRISPNIFLLIGETNAQESSEFLKVHLCSYPMLVAFMFLLATGATILLAERHVRCVVKSHRLLTFIACAIFVNGIYHFVTFLSLFKCQSSTDVDRWVELNHSQPMDNCSNIIYCLYDLYVCGKELEKAESATLMALDHTASTDIDSLNIVLVIGESHIKWHSSLYGYDKNTNPLLMNEKEKGNLFVFTDVYSPYNLTSNVLRNVFSTNSIGLDEKWFDYPFFPVIFRRAGYDVCFWDNQYDPSSSDGFDFSLNAYVHSHVNTSNAFTQSNSKIFEYDDELVVNFSRCFQKHANPLKMIMFHLMGQHVFYCDRYPRDSKFEYFFSDSIPQRWPFYSSSKRSTIAHYDNATRYNDFVLNHIITLFKNEKTVLVYFSDHGEEVYDFRDQEGRSLAKGLDKNVLKYQYQIPFIIWCSDNYIKEYPQQVKQISNAVNKPMIIDNVCHILFNLGGISTDYYVEKLDVLSSDYTCPPRIVNDSIDVDKVEKVRH